MKKRFFCCLFLIVVLNSCLFFGVSTSAPHVSGFAGVNQTKLKTPASLYPPSVFEKNKKALISLCAARRLGCGCRSVLQCAAVCCSVLQCAAVCCSVLQCVAVFITTCCSLLQTVSVVGYGMATISRFLQMTGLFCKKALKKRRYSANETYNFKEPTNRSHPIGACQW